MIPKRLLPANLPVYLALLATVLFAPPSVAGTPRIAIIIDDLGYRYSEGLRATQLPGPVACAILPNTPRGAELAKLAHARGKEVFLHLPLQANEQDGPDEPRHLVLDMSRGQFARAFDHHLSSVPYVAGINTHRGSLLTRHPGHMLWLMEEISSRGNLIFVDSFTTAESIALQLAGEHDIPALKRDVFLDAERSEAEIARQLQRLKNIARERGGALGIGHPFDETLSVLERELPRLMQQGFEVVGVRGLLEGFAYGPATTVPGQ